MKTRNVTVTFVLALAGLRGQSQPTHNIRQPFPTDNRPISGEEWRLSLVAHLLSFPSPVTNGTIQLRGMGDEAAVDVLKVLSLKPTPTSGELQSALDIVHMAFEHPESILNTLNKKPMAALFLFQHLAITVTDAALSQRIANEAKFVRDSVSLAADSTPKR